MTLHAIPRDRGIALTRTHRMLACVSSCVLAAASPRTYATAAFAPPDVFNPTTLGPTDPAAVVDETIEADCDLMCGDTLVNFEKYPQTLKREELASFLEHSRQPIELRRALWNCAVDRWPSFVESLDARRIAQRDAMIRSSRTWGDLQKQIAQARHANTDDNKGEPADELEDPVEVRHRSKHSQLVVRIQAERAALEERFLRELADCAGAALTANAPAGAEASAAHDPTVASSPPQTDPSMRALEVLAPLLSIAKIRNTELSILSSSRRWMSVDVRALLLRCELSDDEWTRAKDSLTLFEATRSSLVLSRYKAEWKALAHETIESLPAWQRVETIERRIREATRAVITLLAGVLTEAHGEHLFAQAATEAYPELAPQLKELARVIAIAREFELSAAAHDPHAQPSDQPSRDELLNALHRALGELDQEVERDGFLFLRSGDHRLEESLERARASLTALATRAP